MKYILMVYFLFLTACGGQALYCQNCSNDSTPVRFYPSGNYINNDCKHKQIQVTEGFVVFDSQIYILEEPTENNVFNFSDIPDLRYDVSGSNLVVENCEYKKID